MEQSVCPYPVAYLKNDMHGGGLQEERGGELTVAIHTKDRVTALCNLMFITLK